MSKLELVREVYAHNEWANNRILESAAQVPEAALSTQPLGSYTRIIDDIAHIIDGQVSWLSRWQTGRSPDDDGRIEAIGSLPALRAEAEKSHRDLREYLAGLTEADVDAEGSYALWMDPAWTEERKAEVRARYADPQVWPRWKMFHHLANHSSYHRGEVALLLTALGSSPGELDFLHYQRSLG
jgi:uncharacterized damage-inducible protein DinB